MCKKSGNGNSGFDHSNVDEPCNPFPLIAWPSWHGAEPPLKGGRKKVGGRLVETGLQGWVVLRRDEASSWRVAAAISSFSCAIPGWGDGGMGSYIRHCTWRSKGSIIKDNCSADNYSPTHKKMQTAEQLLISLWIFVSIRKQSLFSSKLAGTHGLISSKKKFSMCWIL